MNTSTPHSFHIPVMGLGYTIDTPLKVARFGISSVVSIIEDNLLEEMRKFYCRKENLEYVPIPQNEHDARAKRVTAYLNLLGFLVTNQVEKLKSEAFISGSEIVKYFELLPSTSALRLRFNQMMNTTSQEEKITLQNALRNSILPGSIDVNIMTKCDKTNYTKSGDPLPTEFNDAMAALRGFANSKISSSIIFSAGMNPRLYSYCETFNDFFPDKNEFIKKKIVLKVSDYRSALIQGKFLAKKGLWISEFRIESGLNCGGHAFATDGFLLGPILEEFKLKRDELATELFEMCNSALEQKGIAKFDSLPELRISVQGGIGTNNEHNFLLEYYQVDATGWGSPFLLVPEATNVDDDTLIQLASANREDFYLSNASPLGVMFNNFKGSTGNQEREKRIAKNTPGSPCYNKYLAFNTEFTEKPICTASREYQKLKIDQIERDVTVPEIKSVQIKSVVEKECICQGLGTSFYLKNHVTPPHKFNAVSICPGPNLAYFKDVYSLREMVDHIYGRKNILYKQQRPNMFINELNLYVDYLKKEFNDSVSTATDKKNKYLKTFRENLLAGIEYYRPVAFSMLKETEHYRQCMNDALNSAEIFLKGLSIPEPVGGR